MQLKIVIRISACVIYLPLQSQCVCLCVCVCIHLPYNFTFGWVIYTWWSPRSSSLMLSKSKRKSTHFLATQAKILGLTLLQIEWLVFCAQSFTSSVGSLCGGLTGWGLSQMHLPESGERFCSICNSYTTSKGRILTKQKHHKQRKRKSTHLLMNNWTIINDIKIHVISYLLDKNKAFRVSYVDSLQLIWRI